MTENDRKWQNNDNIPSDDRIMTVNDRIMTVNDKKWQNDD